MGMQPLSSNHHRHPRTGALAVGLALILAGAPVAMVAAPAATSSAAKPWMDASLSPDARAGLVLKQMTLQEKLQLVHGMGWATLIPGHPVPKGWNFGAGYVPGIPRLGIPGIHMNDSAVGVRGAATMSRYATLLPSTLGAAASWNPSAAFLYGSVIGTELRDQGFNMTLGGGVDITREPRNGRNFEYAGEDPLLAGTMTGYLIRGVQAQHVMGDIKHYAFNDQETGRSYYNVTINPKAAEESDLLAFRIGIDIGQPAAVMCSYNLVNGLHACESPWLLTDVLRHEIGFKGFVVSDWGGTHSTVAAANAGLDMDQPGDYYGKGFFGTALATAVKDGKVSMATLDAMDQHILRSMFAAGIIDHPVVPRQVVNPFTGRDAAIKLAEQSMVLLRNQDAALPLAAATVGSIAVIGGHADVGVLSGGGSAQVDPPGGNAVNPHPGTAKWGELVYFPSSPLKYLRQHAPNASVQYAAGTDVAAAAALARKSRVAIVFVTQHMFEGMDRPTLALPDHQDALVEAVAAANPHTVVVAETGGPVLMPWADHVAGIVEAWYPGIGGGQALANLLFGTVDFSGRLPVTFPRSDAQLPYPEVTGLTSAIFERAHTDPQVPTAQFTVDYNKAGAAVGYKWFESHKLEPQFPFGFGLAYTSYRYSNLTVSPDGLTAKVTVANTGKRSGAEVAQIYASLPQAADEHYRRLVGFSRIELAPGQSRTLTIALNPLTESVFDPATQAFKRLPGSYVVYAGSSSADTPLTARFSVK